jgi:phosphonatase-like hydrolase
MKTKLVIFDLAGTTVKDNRDVERTLDETLNGFGVYASEEDVNAVMGIPKPVAIHQLLSKYSEPPTQERVAEIHEVFIQNMIGFYQNDSSIAEHDGVSDVFAVLKKNGIKVGIDTGFNRPIADALLSRLGWKEKGLIDYTVTSDEVERGRPFPDLIHSIMMLAGVYDPDSVVKVGDTVADLQEGSAAACGLIVGVTFGAGRRDLLQREEHTHLIDSIPELLDVLGLNRSRRQVADRLF